jgi:hypothetical protein
MGGMRSLENLWLTNNLLTGTIPSELGLMTSLTALYLTNNFLIGTMPEEICALQLESLEVNCDSVTCDCCTNCAREEPQDRLLQLLLDVSPDGGVALQDQTSPQSRALQFLRLPVNSEYSTDEKIIQRFVMATLYYSLGGDSWERSVLWLTSADECLWYSTSRSDSPCDENGSIAELDLRNNTLQGTIPEEIVLLSDSLCK